MSTDATVGDSPLAGQVRHVYSVKDPDTSFPPDTIRFRSRDWFDDPERIDQTALYLERYMNYGITPDELRSGKPIVGISQTGSDLVPCNRHHLELARRVRDGIRDAGGIHAAWYSEESMETLKSEVAREVVRVLSGERPRSPVNEPTGAGADG